MRARTTTAALAALLLALAGCGDEADEAAPAASAPDSIDRVVKIDGDRGLYLRCTGRGSPTVVMEGGDGDTSDSYAFAEPAVSEVTRACVYDRAGLGRSDPPPGPRGLRELVRDLERLLRAAAVPAPYVLVGTSGGGYITAGYAAAHPRELGGLVFVDTYSPFRDPPKAIVEETAPGHPANAERRDYLQVERDAWAARGRIGDVPVKVITARPPAAAIRESPFRSERRAMRGNVDDQKGWLVLSPRAEQIVVDGGHAIEEEDPRLVIDAILATVAASR